jgi:hypothetical protein
VSYRECRGRESRSARDIGRPASVCQEAVLPAEISFLCDQPYRRPLADIRRKASVAPATSFKSLFVCYPVFATNTEANK